MFQYLKLLLWIIHLIFPRVFYLFHLIFSVLVPIDFFVPFSFSLPACGLTN